MSSLSINNDGPIGDRESTFSDSAKYSVRLGTSSRLSIENVFGKTTASTMPIPFTCPYCGRFTSVADDFAGRSGSCGACGAPITIPHAGPDSGNPYESPASSWGPYDDSAQLRGGMVWILFLFEGRIPRRIWWMVNLLTGLIMYGGLFASIAIVEQGSFDGGNGGLNAAFLAVVAIASIPLLWIDIAVTAKRFHDRDKSGWWYLIRFVPYIGRLWILVECGCLRGTYGPNMFGPDPT